jgi:hypothetical protein
MRANLFESSPAKDQNPGSLAGKEIKVVKYDGSQLTGEKSKGFAPGMEIEFTDGTRLIINALLVEERVGEGGHILAHVPVVVTHTV